MCVFSKGRYEEWTYILLRGRNNFVLELIVSGWKNKDQTNMNTEIHGRFVKREPFKGVLYLVRLELDLIK